MLPEYNLLLYFVAALGIYTYIMNIIEKRRQSSREAAEPVTQLEKRVSTLEGSLTTYIHEREVYEAEVKHEKELHDQEIGSKLKSVRRQLQDIREENGIIMQGMTRALHKSASERLSKPEKRRRADESDDG